MIQFIFLYFLKEKIYILHKIKIKNINNEVKLYRVFTDKNILFLMEKEGLNSKNSILLTKEGIPTLHLEVAKVIKYNNDKEKNIFNLFFELSPDDKKILSLNFETYFECSNFKYEYTEERQKFYAILKKFIQTDNKEKNIIFLMGKPGIGKSISLLYFLSKIPFKHCYFDFSKIINTYEKSLLYNECFKLFINDDFGIYKNLFEKIDSMKNIWDKIDFIFSNISILEKAIIVIDSYNSDFDEGFMNLKLLSNKFPNFKFIICLDESDKYSKEIFLDYFFPEKEKKIYSNILIIDNLLYSIENTVNTNKNLYKLFSLFNFIPQYYYDFLNLFPSNDAKEIKENIQKFLSLKIDEFQKCLKKILKQNRLCEIYKQFHYDIINKNEIKHK